MSGEEFNTLMNVIESAYGEAIIKTNEQAKVWYKCLEDLNGEIALAAMYEYFKRSSRSPKIADIRDAYMKESEQPQWQKEKKWQ